MKNLFKTLIVALAIISCPVNVSSANAIKHNYNFNFSAEECVSDIEIMNYVNRLGYNFVEIVEEIDCDRIVSTETVYLYVMVRGGKIVGAEVIGN